MAYNPNLYNPYGQTNFQQYAPPQPMNGLMQVDSFEGAELYVMPPNSVSPPLFLTSDNVFFVKTTDAGGAATIKRYRFEEEEIEPDDTGSDYVTKADFKAFADKVMEAINGKHPSTGQRQAQGELVAGHDIPAQEGGTIGNSVQQGIQ